MMKKHLNNPHWIRRARGIKACADLTDRVLLIQIDIWKPHNQEELNIEFIWGRIHAKPIVGST